jgi:hypothetical protein
MNARNVRALALQSLSSQAAPASGFIQNGAMNALEKEELPTGRGLSTADEVRMVAQIRRADLESPFVLPKQTSISGDVR